MIKVKGNYKNGYPDQTCRACKEKPESQKHVFYECNKLHPEMTTRNNNPDNNNTTMTICTRPKINTMTEVNYNDNHEQEKMTDTVTENNNTENNDEARRDHDNNRDDSHCNDNEVVNEVFNENPDFLKTIVQKIDITLDDLIKSYK